MASCIAIDKIESIFLTITENLAYDDRPLTVSLKSRNQSRASTSSVSPSGASVESHTLSFPGSTSKEAWRFSM